MAVDVCHSLHIVSWPGGAVVSGDAPVAHVVIVCHVQQSRT